MAARHTLMVEASAAHGLQVRDDHEQGRTFLAVAFQTQKNTQGHIVYAALHGAVHGLGVPCVTVLPQT